MRKQCMNIISDIIYLYKNFIHWNISKILISIWSILLGFIIVVPIFIIAIIIWSIDPIQWRELLSFVLSWSDISYNIVWEIAMHPYWLVSMVFLIVIGVFLFLLASGYSLLLQANLSLHYLKGKQLKYKKNLYFSVSYISIFMSIICWNFMYLLSPVLVWVGVIFFTYLFFNIGFITLEVLSILIAIATVILILLLVYLVYRIIFWYVLLAQDSKKKKLLSWREYLQKSIKITKWNSFWKFLFICIAYSLILLPFTSFDAHLERESLYLKDTMIYNSWIIDTIEPNQVRYYEYITAEYSSLSNDEISNKIELYYILRIILFFLTYLLFSGLFIHILVSFYIRILRKK